MTSRYLNALRDVETRYETLVVKLERVHKRYTDSHEEDSKELLAIMSAACKNARDAAKDPDASAIRQDLLQKTNALLDEAIDTAYDYRWDFFDFLPSYAHTDDGSASLVEDPAHDENLFMSIGNTFFKIYKAHVMLKQPPGAPPPTDDFPRPAEFNKTPKPHNNTSPLARFRSEDVIPQIPSSAPVAQAVFYGCCSISSKDRMPPPVGIITAPNADVLLMSGRTGYKEAEAFLDYYDLSTAPKGKGMPKGKFLKKTGLNDIAYHIAIDASRKLLWAADRDRAKSFSYDPNNLLLPVHTLRCERSGPLAVLDGGARVLRGGKDGVDVWNIDELSTHGPAGSDRIGEGEETLHDIWRDIDGTAYIEPSTGAPRTSSIDFTGTIDQWHIPSRWATGGKLKALTAAEEDQSTALARDLRDGGKVTMRYLGHGGTINCITSSDEDPNSFLTAADDGFVRLFDVREPTPQLTINAGECSEHCFSALYIHVNGIPVIFTGGAHKTQCIRVWDPRAKKLVYELATGNNSVQSLAWDAPRSTLYAATECNALDRAGIRHGYRRLRMPDGDNSIHDKRRQPAGEPPRKRARLDAGDGDGDDEGDDFEEECDLERGWPKRAYHNEKYFGYAWDCGDHRLVHYKFGIDADPTIVPEYGDASPGEENRW
ncbi:WD40-repeat-containing domain protein [Schizophyllum commune]